MFNVFSKVNRACVCLLQLSLLNVELLPLENTIDFTLLYKQNLYTSKILLIFSLSVIESFCKCLLLHKHSSVPESLTFVLSYRSA